MGIHKRHVPAGLAGKLKVERDPDGKLRLTPPLREGRDPIRPETIAQERPETPPNPAPMVDRNWGA